MTHENRFGLFIHWGVYALTGLHEQALARYGMAREEYERLKDDFNPVRFDPEAWVLLAKNAGMKYICFTAKHHDGFCMWNTEYTDYSIMHTPYGRDVLRLLADACAKHGMALSIYYSLPDWHHPNAYNPRSSHQWRAVAREENRFDLYLDYVRNQIRELLTGYGPIYTLFWDIPPQIHDPSLNNYVRSLQPGIFINNRGFDEGDFSTPEREEDSSASLLPYARMTEACNSIDSQSWGYRQEADFYSLRHLLSSIDQVMARGGSYLLNIGPMADGSLHPEHAARIERIGRWYTAMDGCLECHEPDLFDYRMKGAGPCIVTKKNGKSYFHFFDGLMTGAVALDAYPSIPKSVRLMNTGACLPFERRALPGFYTSPEGLSDRVYLQIRRIPVDELSCEPIVIEVEWE